MEKKDKPSSLDKTYAVGISSRGIERIPYIQDIVCAFENSVNKPQYIVVVDNNEVSVLEGKIKSDVPVHIVKSEYGKNVPSGSQTALDMFINDNIDIAFKWDDSSVPQEGCIDRIFTLALEGYPAVGGVFPPHFEQRLCYYIDDKALFVPDYNVKHVQFFKWKEPVILDSSFLYSSFAYNIKKAQEIGGFFVNYSDASYRDETDFTLRLSNGQNVLKIDTQAVSTKYLVTEESKEIVDEKRNLMLKVDDYIFNKRMKELGIEWK
jgi:hypothetical protein